MTKTIRAALPALVATLVLAACGAEAPTSPVDLPPAQEEATALAVGPQASNVFEPPLLGVGIVSVDANGQGLVCIVGPSSEAEGGNNYLDQFGVEHRVVRDKNAKIDIYTPRFVPGVGYKTGTLLYRGRGSLHYSAWGDLDEATGIHVSSYRTTAKASGIVRSVNPADTGEYEANCQQVESPGNFWTYIDVSPAKVKGKKAK